MIWNHRHDVESKRSRTFLVATHIAFGVAIAALLALIFGYFVMLLWNAVMPGVMAVSSITYSQGVGMLLLARILVGGIGRHGNRHGHGRWQRREAWREYEEWWREVGKQSFKEFTGGQSEQNNK
jgi:hypothetical protein